MYLYSSIVIYSLNNLIYNGSKFALHCILDYIHNKSFILLLTSMTNLYKRNIDCLCLLLHLIVELRTLYKYRL